MSKTLKFVRLDFFTLKPYMTLKNLIIFVFVAFIMGAGMGSADSVISIFAAYGLLYMTYLFAVGEQNGIDALYSTLSISRKNVVMGRYIFTVCGNMLASVIGYILCFIVFAILKKPFVVIETVAVLAAVFLVFGFILAIQLPIYFKLGYAKAKLLAYLPFACVPVIILAFGTFFKTSGSLSGIYAIVEWISLNPLIAIALFVIAWLSALLASYKLSLQFYGGRDF